MLATSITIPKRLVYLCQIANLNQALTPQPEADYSVDQKSLRLVYENWPQHFKNALSISCSIDKDPSFYETLFFCGMGGSATSCDILNEIMQSEGNRYSTVVRGGSLPNSVNKRSLVIVNSVSGNTEEALAMASQAADKNAEVICVSSGGKLKEFASSRGVKQITIPNLFVPRASLPYLVVPGLKLISPFLNNPISNELEMVQVKLIEEKNRIASHVPVEKNLARKLAIFLKDSFVFCFTSPSMLSAGTRFKNSLNENAKTHCTKESILESMHNEIVPFTFDTNTLTRKVIFLKWDMDNDFVHQKFQKVQNLFKEIGQPYFELSSQESSLILAILRFIYILDFATVYMAITYGIDPTPTPAIDILKNL
jgi:glucose/mannose-6-phosphate isomerase